MKKVALHIVLIIILQKSEFFTYRKKLTKSVVNKNENNYYYDLFLEKSSCENKSNTQYF